MSIKSIGNFIMFDKRKKNFYDNYYINKIKLVLKVPICDDEGNPERGDSELDKFNLSEKIFLLSLDLNI